MEIDEVGNSGDIEKLRGAFDGLLQTYPSTTCETTPHPELHPSLSLASNPLSRLRISGTLAISRKTRPPSQKPQKYLRNSLSLSIRRSLACLVRPEHVQCHYTLLTPREYEDPCDSSISIGKVVSTSIRDLIVCLSSAFTIFQPVSHNIVKDQDPTYGVDLPPVYDRNHKYRAVYSAVHHRYGDGYTCCRGRAVARPSKLAPS